MFYKDFGDPNIKNTEPLSLYVLMFQSGEIIEGKIERLIDSFQKQYMRIDNKHGLQEQILMMQTRANET